MQVFFTEVREMLVPGQDPRHGPLPLLLVLMTMVTGLVDSFSYLVISHVFVANMTGNIVFMGFAFAGTPAFSIRDSLFALVFFVLGTLGGGLLLSHLSQHRGRLLSINASVQTFLLGIATILAVLAGHSLTVHSTPADYRLSLVFVLGLAMGLQNATARRLAVPDLTTSVLTMTIVGIAADARLVGGKGSKAGRRLIAVGAMFLGALCGSLLIFHVAPIAPLVGSFLLTFLIATMAHWFSQGDQTWMYPSRST